MGNLHPNQPLLPQPGPVRRPPATPSVESRRDGRPRHGLRDRTKKMREQIAAIARGRQRGEPEPGHHPSRAAVSGASCSARNCCAFAWVTVIGLARDGQWRRGKPRDLSYPAPMPDFRITGRSLPDRIGWNLSESNQSQASRNDQAGTTPSIQVSLHYLPPGSRAIWHVWVILLVWIAPVPSGGCGWSRGVAITGCCVIGCGIVGSSR